MKPEKAIEAMRGLYDLAWRDHGDVNSVVVGKDDTAWVLSAEVHPTSIVDRLLAEPDQQRLPDGPWDYVGTMGTAYVEMADDMEQVLARAGNLASKPSPRTWHALSLTVVTGEGELTVLWRSEIRGEELDVEPVPMMELDDPRGAIRDSLVKLANSGKLTW